MIDTLKKNYQNLVKPSFFDDYGLENEKYIILTLHRQSNCSSKEKVENILNSISSSTKGVKIIFPAHPRVSKILKNLSEIPKNIIVIEPQPYLEFNYLVKNSIAVITDSGGITEETTYLNIPCLTLRDSTERPETVIYGTNELIGGNFSKLEKYMDQIIKGNWKSSQIPEKWDGKSGARIVEAIIDILSD